MLSLVVSLLLSPSYAQQKVEIKSFSPQGYVKSVDQVRIEFSEPMVKLGDIKLEAPAQSSCFDPKKGQGRWVDTKNWVFDFTKTVPGGQTCDVTYAGKKYSFNTGGPHIDEVLPNSYQAIEPQQYFVMMLDSEVKKESVKDGLYFVLQGLGDRIPAEVVDGSKGREVIAAAKKMYGYGEERIKDPILVVKAKKDFPAAAKVSLVWSKGIQSPSGHSSPEDQVIEFSVEEPFKAEFNCDREAPGQPCVPLLAMRVNLNSSIELSAAKQIYLQTADKKIIRPSFYDDPNADESITTIEFKGPFKEETSYTLIIPSKLKDERGRLLTNQNQFPLQIKTGGAPALLKFAAPFGVIEAGPQAAMALTLRRVENSIKTQFAGWSGSFNSKDFGKILDVLGQVQRSSYGAEPLTFPSDKKKESIKVLKPNKASALEVVGIPFKKPGFYVVEMESPLLGQALLAEAKPYYVRSAALVTNMAVHVKYTENDALMWVTELVSGKAVSSAEVEIYDTLGNQITKSTTDAQGLAYVKFSKPLEDWEKNPQGTFYGGFFAVAKKGEDFSFTHSSWDRGIENWRYQLSTPWQRTKIYGHAILDRNLLRPEETLSAKIILRRPTSSSLALPLSTDWPETFQLSHDSGLQNFKLPLKWDKKTGTALITWKVPAGTKLGRWNLTLDKKDPESSISVGDLAIENFRVPALQVEMSSAKPSYVMDKNVPVNVNGTYLSGGPASDLEMKLRWSVEPGYFQAEDEDLRDYSFLNGAVKEGLVRSGEEDGGRYIPQSGVQDFKLSKEGSAQSFIKNLKYSTAPQKLRTELEYKDPNGEIQSTHRSYTLWSSSAIVGIKANSWWATPEKVDFSVVALDTLQKPLVNQEVKVELFTSQYISHRKRLVGGFYSYEGFQRYKKVADLCQGKTDSSGKYTCTGKSPVAGSLLAVVSTKDKDGRIVYANVNQWVIKKGEQQWFGSEDNDRIDLIPFKKNYEPGEVAEFQLRGPFNNARVLVTVERESVLHKEIIEVSGDKPSIRLPIKKEYAPNVVVSAFMVRGRLNDPKPTALVDLGKPAFKMGMAQIKVGWKANTLKVQVQTDKKTYKARETSQALVKVTDQQGRPAKNAEVVLVAVDEGLLQLRDNDTWDLLSSMMRLRSHDVQTATAQSWVVGKRHFGLKALPIGGDGGGGLRRELFDTLLYWNPSVKLNAKGEARVPVKLNDSTTSFRFVAIALQGVDQFGTGWTSIQSSQDLIITPGLAAVARQGDIYRASFHVRNAMSADQTVKMSLSIGGQSQKEQTLQLKAGQAQEVFWNVTVPNVASLSFIVKATDANNRLLDEVKKDQTVLPVQVPRIYQSEWGQWPDFKSVGLQQAAGSDPLQTSVIVEVQKGLGGSLTGIEDFWRNYQYNCLEQQVSRAISLNDKKLWAQIEARLSTYIDRNGFLKYFPGTDNGSVALTSYILSIAHEAGFSFSEDNENRLLESLSSFAEGQTKEAGSDRADYVLKKISAFEALSRYRRLNKQLLTAVEFRGNEWPLYTLTEWYQILLLEKDIPQRDQKLKDVEAILRNKFYFSAKRLLLRDENQERLSWLMRDSTSGLVRLVLTTLQVPQWKQDTPRLFQGILARQSEGSWALTTDNAWGALAIRKVQQSYNAESIQGTFKAQLGSVEKSHNWSQGNSSKAMIFDFKESKGDVKFNQEGAGKPWITVSMKGSIPVQKPVFSGFTIEKSIAPLEQKNKGRWTVGDTAKVTLKIKTPASQSWVVVDDPIPAGTTILQSSYATAIERKYELMRFYFDWFNSGDNEMTYTIRFNQAGTYKLPVTRVEAMYSPDVFAELPESSFKVEE